MSIEKNIIDSNHQNEVLTSGNPFFEVRKLMSDLIRKKDEIKYEFDQFRIRSEEETKRFLLELLKVVDAFERLFNIIKEKEEMIDPQTRIWIGNFRTIYRLLLRALREIGVYPLDTFIGEKVNPHMHNVVESVKEIGHEEGTIVEIIKKGYLWKNKILRTVEVKAVKSD